MARAIKALATCFHVAGTLCVISVVILIFNADDRTDLSGIVLVSLLAVVFFLFATRFRLLDI